MQKKLLALAVAGALVPAAAMAQSSVEIYGRANLGFDSWEADGATLGSAFDFDRRNRVYDGSSRVGFRVNEALGGGMRAFVVIETGVNIDTGNTLGQGGVNASTGTWASRDSYVGLGGGWGDVRFGRQSVWWANGVIAQTGANYINTAVDGLINDPGLLAIPSARQSSVVSYNSPTFGGFNASLSYSPHTQESGVTFDGAADEGSVWGITGRFTTGAIRAQADWAINQSIGNVDGSDNTGLKVGLGFAYAPGSQISGIIGRLTNETNALGEFKQNFFLVNWEHMLGQFQLLAQLYNSQEVDAPGGEISDSGATGVTLAGKYFLSKRTGVYASFSTVRNDAASWADMSGAGMSSAGGGGLTAASAGADVKLFAVGVMHNF
jgi:predicted porin